jgi:type VI protein secretion system component Hcp
MPGLNPSPRAIHTRSAYSRIRASRKKTGTSPNFPYKTQGEYAVIKNVCLAIAASTALIAGTAQAASDFFLKIVGITGTSQVVGFTDYIDIFSYSVGFTNGACSSLNVMKKMDTASADITAAALLGTTYPSAVLVGRKAGTQPFVYLRVTLTNVKVTSLQDSGSAGGDDVPTESVSMQPSSVKIESFVQDSSGNSVLAATNTVSCQKLK